MTRFLFLALLLSGLAGCAQRATTTAAAASATAQPADAHGLHFDPGDTTWSTPVTKTDEEWRKFLTAEEFEITRRQGTERPFTSPLYELEDQGIYYCISCANPLYSSATKFHSGTGWPSFYQPYARKSVATIIDNSHGMLREEVVCARCQAHLGHVFDDGPDPTGLRYCMDGVALYFVKSK